jgi:hypothetical protein
LVALKSQSHPQRRSTPFHPTLSLGFLLLLGQQETPTIFNERSDRCASKKGLSLDQLYNILHGNDDPYLVLVIATREFQENAGGKKKSCSLVPRDETPIDLLNYNIISRRLNQRTVQAFRDTGLYNGTNGESRNRAISCCDACLTIPMLPTTVLALTKMTPSGSANCQISLKMIFVTTRNILLFHCVFFGWILRNNGIPPLSATRSS